MKLLSQCASDITSSNDSDLNLVLANTKHEPASGGDHKRTATGHLRNLEMAGKWCSGE